MPVDGENHRDIASPSQGQRDLHVELVQAGDLALRAGKEYRRIHATDAGPDVRQTAVRGESEFAQLLAVALKRHGAFQRLLF